MRDDRLAQRQQQAPATDPASASDVLMDTTLSAVEMVDGRTGQVLIRIPREQVPAFIRQLTDAQGGAILAAIHESKEEA